jgi:spore coat protein U-like protein
MRAGAPTRCTQGSHGASTSRGGSLFVALVVMLAASVTARAVAAPAVSGAVTVTSAPLAFGLVYPAHTFTGTATLTVAAPPGLNFQVAVDGGFHFSAGFRHLKRADGGETIPYSLFIDQGCTLALGDAGLGGAFLSGNSVAATGIGRDQLIPIYGRLMVPDQAPPGLYADSLMVTVIY